MRFRLTTLGDLALHRADGGARVGAARRKPLALLAVLAAHHPAAVPRARVAALLWPESLEPRARHSLAQALYALRRDCGQAIVLGEEALRLDVQAVAVDLHECHAALATDRPETAAERYLAPFLDGVGFPNCDEFERWCERQRHQCRASLREALRLRARSLAGALAAEAWTRAAAIDPLDADLAVEGALALEAGGDPLGARRLLAEHVLALRHELDEAPDARTATLLERLRRLVPPLPDAPALPPAARPPLADSTDSPVGQPGDRTLLQRLLRRAVPRTVTLATLLLLLVSALGSLATPRSVGPSFATTYPGMAAPMRTGATLR